MASDNALVFVDPFFVDPSDTGFPFSTAEWSPQQYSTPLTPTDNPKTNSRPHAAAGSRTRHLSNGSVVATLGGRGSTDRGAAEATHHRAGNRRAHCRAYHRAGTRADRPARQGAVGWIIAA